MNWVIKLIYKTNVQLVTNQLISKIFDITVNNYIDRLYEENSFLFPIRPWFVVSEQNIPDLTSQLHV